MDMDFASKKLGNAGLTTGIIGTSLGALNALGGNLFGGNVNAAPPRECHFEESPVSKYEFTTSQNYIKEIEDKNAEIAYLRAEKYSDQVGIGVYKEVAAMIKEERAANDAKFAMINQQLGAQAVMNQSTKDSFQLLQERLDCCKTEMCGALARERDERKCADNIIVTYTNATFYPKQVADVTVGTTTVAQTVYNPLPVNTCGC